MPHSVVGGCDTAGQVHSVAVTGNYACVIGRRWTGAASVGFIELFDFSVPANCVRVAAISAVLMLPTEWRQPATTPTSRIAKGGLHVISVSIPANPQRVGGYEPSIMPHNVTVSGNYACVADDTDGLQVIDVSNPANPQRVGGYATGGYATGVAVSSNFVYVADRNAGVAVSGHFACVADWTAGLRTP
jgi:hypothetical protein